MCHRVGSGNAKQMDSGLILKIILAGFANELNVEWEGKTGVRMAARNLAWAPQVGGWSYSQV